MWVVKELEAPWLRSGQNVTADNFLTSIHLTEDLLIDALCSNKPHLPDAMRASYNREVYSSLFGFKDQWTLLSHVPMQNKSFLAVSTMHHNASVAGEVHKPEILLHQCH